MKQYLVISRAYRKGLFDIIEPTIYTDEDLDVAIKIVNDYNKYKHPYKKEVVELTSLIQFKAECDMSEDEANIYRDTISEMDSDLHNIVDYDEWSAREFGETRVDYWYTAKNLYNAGYRKITKIEE